MKATFLTIAAVAYYSFVVGDLSEFEQKTLNVSNVFDKETRFSFLINIGKVVF